MKGEGAGDLPCSSVLTFRAVFKGVFLISGVHEIENHNIF